jgi:hypothetical protein
MTNVARATLRGPVDAPHRWIHYACTRRATGGRLTAVDLRRELPQDEFVARYLSSNRPVLVSDAVERWPARHWTLAALEREFGDHAVTLQSSEFAEERVTTLRSFLRDVQRYERMSTDTLPPPSALPYARNVPAGAGEDFSAAVFARLAEGWARPYFMPVGGYVSPRQLLCSLPNYQPHPHRALYISPRGAATALHVDAGFSNALLAQIEGEKKIFLFSPAETARLPRHPERRPAHYLRGERPDFGNAVPVEITLRPGMMLFIPKYHWHEVYTLSASLSLTYNFVHASDVTWQWLRDRYAGPQRGEFAPLGDAQGQLSAEPESNATAAPRDSLAL